MKKILLILAIFYCGCQQEKNTETETTNNHKTFSQLDTSAKGMVTAAHPLAMQAGLAMLEKGGNAVDAAVATGFALAVVEPSMSGLGGRLQAIIRLPDGTVQGIDATTQAPMDYDAATAPKGAYGYATIGIPGVVAGLTKLLENHGTLSLEEVMAPAIAYATNGYAMLPGEALRHQLETERIKEFSGTSKYFLKPDSTTYQAGETIVQKDLSQTLQQIAKGGSDAFYRGEIAEKIAADMQANGGIINLKDLNDYEAKESAILSSNYRGYDVHALTLPSYGAITLEILNILENLPANEPEEDWAMHLYQAMDLGYLDRGKQFADSIPILISKEYALQQAKLLMEEATAFRKAKPTYPINVPESWLADQGHTTHYTTADSSGTMVAITQSLGPNMGSRVATDGLGFLYAVTLGGYLGEFEPGQRAASHISPVLLTKDNQPFMALGAAGGSRIVTAIVSVISRVIDQHMALDSALQAPRVHPDEDTILVEMNTGMGWKDEMVEALEAEGFDVKEVPEAARFGRVHAILFDPETGVITGAADPDWEGAAGGLE